jgi:hypothetical protein
MYYPKSQIQANLYTNGNEYVIASSNEIYAGYYWKTSSGKFFTGKTPEDTPSVELKLKSKLENVSAVPNSTTTIFNSEFTTREYNSIKQIQTPSPLLLPTYYLPQPTEQDYQVGEFQRYFVKKTNELIYTEVNKDTHDKIQGNDPQWLWPLYTPFSLPWNISGDKLQVAKTNKNIVDLTMQRLKLYKFNEYLRNDYLKFYL